MDHKSKDVRCVIKGLIIVLLLCNCVLVVEGYNIRGCYIYKQKAFCNNQKLLNIPTDIPHYVKDIDLGKNHFTNLQVLNFTNFPNLTTLDLKRNLISYIGKRTFSHLLSLNRLILNSNKIDNLQDDVFDGLPKLTELLLGFNLIQTVAQNAFRSLSSLKILDLSNNRLGTIEQVRFAIQHTPQLKNLQIQNNGIKTFISKDLTNTSINISYLGLSKNPLEKFEVTAAVFPELLFLNIGSPSAKLNLTWAAQSQSVVSNVTTLDISGVRLASSDEWRRLFSSFNSSLTFLRFNSMKYRPTALMNMSCSIPTLSKLQLQDNKFRFISSSFFQMCHNISEIDLEGNNIKHIDNSSFTNLRLLKVLSIKHNRLQNVPFATRNLPSLQKLDLSFNSIGTVQCQDFARLTNLMQLNLQWNNLTALSKCSFSTLSKLEILKLQGNGISNLGGAFQKNLPKLKVLLLNQNKLTAIRKHDFKGLHSLLNLSLFENHIQTLEKSCFHGLKSLAFLWLQMNNLKSDALNNNSFTDLVNLTRLDLAMNHFKYWSSDPLIMPPFRNLSNLETLIFSVQRSKGKGFFPSNFLQGLKSLSTFFCNNIQLLSFPDNFFTHTPRLTFLDISANELGNTNFSSNLFIQVPNLMRLKINSIYLRSLDFLISANLTKLNFLEARKNTFSVLSKDIIQSVPSLSVLDLKFNGFLCDCDNAWFVQWIINNSQTEVVDAHSFRCSYPPQTKNKKLLHLKVQSCILDVGFIFFITTTCVNILILVTTFTYHFSRFQLIYAYYIFLAWLFDSRNRKKRTASEYDAFVSYNTHDEAWIYRELVPHLEKEQGWRLCLHHRDFLPGKPIVENIADAIYGSRKTICVISRRYLQSEWCSKEMQLASFRLFDEREDVLILVFLEEIPSAHMSPYYRMKRVLKKRTYLSWPRASEQQLLFWEKLRQALGSTNSAAEDRLLLTVTA